MQGQLEITFCDDSEVLWEAFSYRVTVREGVTEDGDVPLLDVRESHFSFSWHTWAPKRQEGLMHLELLILIRTANMPTVYPASTEGLWLSIKEHRLLVCWWDEDDLEEETTVWKAGLVKFWEMQSLESGWLYILLPWGWLMPSSPGCLLLKDFSKELLQACVQVLFQVCSLRSGSWWRRIMDTESVGSVTIPRLATQKDVWLGLRAQSRSWPERPVSFTGSGVCECHFPGRAHFVNGGHCPSALSATPGLPGTTHH